jgi:hypothetical protein
METLMGDPSVEQTAIAIMRMLVGKKGLKAGDTMPNGLVLDAVKELGLEDLRRSEALTFAGDKAWLESRDGSTLLSETGYAVGAANDA